MIDSDTHLERTVQGKIVGGPHSRQKCIYHTLEEGCTHAASVKDFWLALFFWNQSEGYLNQEDGNKCL